MFGNLDHFYLHNNSFHETGAQSINLSVDAKTSNALRSELGLRYISTFVVDYGAWTPYAQMSWVNKTLLSISHYTSGFLGQVGTFSVSTTSRGSNQWAPGLGLEYSNQKNMTFLVETRAELNGKMKNYFGSARFEYSF